MSQATAAVAPQSELEEFQEFLAFKKMKAANGGAPPPGAPETIRKVRELWLEWLPTLGNPLPEYIASHAQWFLDFKFPFEGQSINLGAQPWIDLTPRMGQAWWAHLRKQLKDTGRETEATKRGDLLSAGYCNRIRTSASGMFSYHVDLTVKAGSKLRSARRLDEVTENPIHNWPRAQAAELGERLGSFNDEEHLEDFLQHGHPVWRLMSRLSSRCGGMRKSEVRLLRFSYVNWDKCTITLPKDTTREEGRNKNGESRTFPVDDLSMEILRTQRAAHESYSEWVFPNATGRRNDVGKCEPYSDGAMNSWQLDAAASWGQLIDGERPCFHHLRHTWAKWSIIRGMPLTQVMEYGGWKSYDVAKKYMKASQAMLEQARNKSRVTIREAIAAQTLSGDERRAPRRARFVDPQQERGSTRR